MSVAKSRELGVDRVGQLKPPGSVELLRVAWWWYAEAPGSLGRGAKMVTRYVRHWLAVASGLLLVPVPASALQYGQVPLDFRYVGITATGPIVPGDLDRLSAFIKTLSQSGRTLSFFVDSPGGNIYEASKIAALINKSAAAVAIPSGSQCSSACFLLFAAAAHRFMAPDALIGVHSASYDGQENLTSMGITTAFARYAADYGVPPAIIGKMVQTEPGRMAWLTPSDLQSMGVALLPAAAPQAQPLPATPAQAAPPTQAIPPTKTTYVIHVASKQNQTEALATFFDMQHKYPKLVASYRPMVQKADLGSEGIWYRLFIGPMSNKETASRLCAQLKSQGHSACVEKAAPSSSSIAQATSPPPLGREPAIDEFGELRISDLRHPYPTVYPEKFEIVVLNAGSQTIAEITIGFVKTNSQGPCSRTLDSYDGFQTFRNLFFRTGDSVTLKGDFSPQAKRFCIVSARATS